VARVQLFMGTTFRNWVSASMGSNEGEATDAARQQRFET